MPPGALTPLLTRLALSVLVLAFASLTAPLLAAQGPSRLSGIVTDAAGNPLPSSTIRLVYDDGRVLEIPAGGDGGFEIDVDGRFSLEVRSPGFRTIETNAIALGPGAPYVIDFALLAGYAADVEFVELLIEDPEGFADPSAPSAREDLPKSDRLFGLRGGLNVSGIAEGSSQQWIAASGSVFASSPTATTMIQPSDLSAENASSVGFDDSLPPGGPRLNGNAYYYHRNDTLNARNFFDPPDEPIPPFKYHFFGAEVGGELGEGTYGFARYWGLRIRQSLTRAARVPPTEWLQGDFSSSADTILDPETGFPFEGNVIPPERLHPEGVRLARLFPPPNAGNGIQNFLAVDTLRTLADAFGVRLDHRLTDADELSVEFQHSRDTTDDPFNLVTGITNLPGFGVRDGLETQTLRINDTHVFTPGLYSQFRFTFGRLEQPRSIPSETRHPAVIITGFSNVGHAANLPQDRRNTTLEGSASATWIHGARETRFGGRFASFDFDAFVDLLGRGQFQFNGGSFAGNSLANLLLGLPANALRITGDTRRRFGTWTGDVWVQHEWRLRPSFQLDLGLRYDYQSPFEESDHRVANFTASGTFQASPDALYGTDRDNIGPRVGIAWSPFGDTVVRAGYGIFYDNLAVGDSLYLLGLNPPFVRFEVEDNDPVLPRFDLGTVFQDPRESVPPSVFSAARTLSNPYVQHWSLLVGRTIAPGYDATVSYLGQKGTHLRRQINLNQPSPGPAVTLEERRPFPAFGNIFQFETSASSTAHALDVGVVRRGARGLGFRVGYRLARMIDDATLISILPQNSHDLAAERALSDFHVKHRFTFSATAAYPWMYGLQLQAIGTFQSGTPLSAILGTDVAGTGSPIVNRPDLVGDPGLDDPTPSRFFDPAAFAVPEFGSFGNSGRNVIIGPGVANVDLALTRSFRLSDGLRAQLRADFYNAFNQPNFIAPPTMQNFADSPDFGALFVARSPRIVQAGLRIFW